MPKKKSSVRSPQPAAQRSQAESKRRIKPAKYKSFRISKRLRQAKPGLMGAFRLFFASAKFIVKRWKLYGGIILIYTALTLILVNGFNISSTGLFGGLRSYADNSSGAYKTLLSIIISLALIWALRNNSAAAQGKITVKDSFYKGMYPFIPFILVLLVIGLQLLPLIVANYLYIHVLIGGLAVTAIEKGLWIVFLLALVLLSLYMVSSSLFALYIVTLPDVKPIQALKTARDLVRHRRAVIMRKVLFLPLVLVLLAAIIVVPAIMLSEQLAEYLFFALSMIAPAVVHSYYYRLYRELL